MIDERHLHNYFENYIPEMKAQTEIAKLNLDIQKAIFLADVYRTSSSELNSLKQNIDSELKEIPFYAKILMTIFPLFNPRKTIREEIEYRNKGNERKPDEWKQPFIEIVDVYKRKGLESAVKYINEKILPEYQTKRLASV
jgi:hypothetical protein